MKSFISAAFSGLMALMCHVAFGQGANMTNPVAVQTLYTGYFTDTKNNSPSNGYGNDIGQPSDDIYYRIYLPVQRSVTFSTCNSNFDTYMHLLNASGSEIASNDDSGPACPGTLKASITQTLSPGIYYIVVEGYSSNAGDIKTEISCDPFANPSPSGATMANAVEIGSIAPGQTFTDTKNNDPASGFGNDFGQASDDIFYHFSLSAPLQINLSLCGSNFDTYLWILDASGNVLYSNDDNGPLCPGSLQSSLQVQLAAGAYYIVTEGWSGNSGTINLNLTTPSNGSQIITDFSTQMTQVFGQLETSRVPYGLLQDIALERVNLNNYDGVMMADSNVMNNTDFKSLYETVRSAKIDASAGTFTPTDILDSIGRIYRQPGTLVLSGIFYNYSKFTDDAVSSNRVTISNNQVLDKYSSGIWVNPYETKTTFAVAPLADAVRGKTQDILLPAQLWLSNASNAVTKFELDIGDGLGYRIAQFGQKITATFNDIGQKIINFRLTLADHTVLNAHAIIDVQEDIAATYPGIQFIPITSSESYNGKTASGTMTVRYADPAAGMKNPFIIVEGFDPGVILSPEDAYGQTNFSTFMSYIKNTLSESNDLKKMLYTGPDGGKVTTKYDLVYLDWNNGMDDIKRNALLVKELIRKVNSMKAAAGSNAQNIIMGQSMGGLTTRWALKDMENHTEDHQTRLFISQDVPYQGANVPLGYLFMANHFKHLYMRTGVAGKFTDELLMGSGSSSISSLLNLSNQPAARQMLISYVNDNYQVDNSQHDAWQTELKNIGYPQGIAGKTLENVAVSNGSECATLNVPTPGDPLIYYHGTGSTKFWGDLAATVAFPIIGNVMNMPKFSLGGLPGKNTFNFDISVNSVANGGGNNVYTNHIVYKKKLLYLFNVNVDITNESHNAPAGVLSYDAYPGGRYTIGFQPSSAEDNNALVKYNISAGGQVEFGFVPTASALDIGLGNVTLTDADYKVHYIGAAPPASPKNTPFAKFTTAKTNPGVNESHIAVLNKSAQWIADEILSGNATSPDCTLSCNNLQITGNNAFCSSGSYSISYVPAGATIYWSVSNSSVSIIGGQGTPTVQLSGSGRTFDLSVTVSTGCIPGGTTVTKSLTALDANQISIKEYPDHFGVKLCQGTTQLHFLYGNENIPQNNRFGITSISFIPTNNGSATTPQINPYQGNYWDYSAYVSAYMPSSGSGGGYASITVTDQCGQTYGTFIIYQQCTTTNYAMVAYPNPTTSELTVDHNAADDPEFNGDIEAAYEAAKKQLPNVIMAPLDENLKKLAKHRKEEKINFKLYDDKGKIMVDVNDSLISKKTKLDVSHIPNGTYYLHIKHNGSVEKQQILIQH